MSYLLILNGTVLAPYPTFHRAAHAFDVLNDAFNAAAGMYAPCTWVAENNAGPEGVPIGDSAYDSDGTPRWSRAILQHGNNGKVDLVEAPGAERIRTGL